MNILFLSRWFPYPIDNGAKLRIRNLLRILGHSHRVTLLSFNDRPETPADIEAMQQICAQTIAVPWKPYQPTSLKAIIGLLHPNPRAVLDTYSPEMAQQIRTTLAQGNYDAVIASEIETASYRALFGKHPAIFEEVEIGVPYERYRNPANRLARFRSSLTWFKHRRYLQRLLQHFPVCTVASELEHRLLQETGIRNHGIAVIPNFLELADYQGYTPSKKEHALIFTGSFRYQPNYEAMFWFIEQVFPLILEHFPDLRLIITGDHLGLPLPSQRNIYLTGHIPDDRKIHALLASVKVSIVPIHVGGGTRLKILEALALKTPVLSTTKGAEGIAAQHGKHLWIADDPHTFAQAVITLLNDQALCQKLTENGFKLVEDKYSAQAIKPQYEALLKSLCKS